MRSTYHVVNIFTQNRTPYMQFWSPLSSFLCVLSNSCSSIDRCLQSCLSSEGFILLACQLLPLFLVSASTWVNHVVMVYLIHRLNLGGGRGGGKWPSNIVFYIRIFFFGYWVEEGQINTGWWQWGKGVYLYQELVRANLTCLSNLTPL